MENKMVLDLENYEKDFICFQNVLPELRKTNPDQFVAFKNGKVISAGTSIEDVKKELTAQNIEASGAVIEFVSKDDIHVIF